MARKRNTLANVASKQDPFGTASLGGGLLAGGPGVPAPTPEQTAALYGQLSGLYQQYQLQLQQLRLQRQGLRSSARVSRADIRAQGIENMAQSVNQQIESGTLGSSFDLAQRVGVRAETQRGLQDVRSQLLQGLAGTRLSQEQAGISFQQGVFDLQAQAAAQQAQAATQALLANTVLGGAEPTTDVLGNFYRQLLGMFTSSGFQPGPGQQRGGTQSQFDLSVALRHLLLGG